MGFVEEITKEAANFEEAFQLAEAKIASADSLFEKKQNDMIEVQKEIAEYDDLISLDAMQNPFDFFKVQRDNLIKETTRKRDLKESTKKEIKAIIATGI